MKRKAEIVLGVLGIIIFALFTVGGVYAISIAGNQNAQEAIKQAISSNSDGQSQNINNIMEDISDGGWMLTISSAIGIVLGVIAILFIKGNKNRIIAAISFLLGALISIIISFGTAILPAILYLIAGVMSFVRKRNDNHSNELNS